MSKFSIKALLGAAAFGAVAIVGTAANALPITSDTVVIDGDKKFFNFTCIGTNADCASAGVSAILADDVVGIVFTTSALNVHFGESADFFIEYDVMVLPGYDLQIYEIGMSAAGGVGYGGSASVSEQAKNGNPGPQVGNLLVSFNADPDDLPGFPPGTGLDGELNGDMQLTGTFSALHIVKDIGVRCDGQSATQDCTAQISAVKQIFVQTGVPVPEPASLAIFGVALAGLGLARRRKSA